MRDIVGPDLEGKVVLLTACCSASGAVLEGEGVLGLARESFQAGAPTAAWAGLVVLGDGDAVPLQRAIGRGSGLAALILPILAAIVLAAFTVHVARRRRTQ